MGEDELSPIAVVHETAERRVAVTASANSGGETGAAAKPKTRRGRKSVAKRIETSGKDATAPRKPRARRSRKAKMDMPQQESMEVRHE